MGYGDVVGYDIGSVYGCVVWRCDWLAVWCVGVVWLCGGDDVTRRCGIVVWYVGVGL